MDHLLNVVNVSVSLQKKEILHDISFSLDPGSILMLVGPNGAGKIFHGSRLPVPWAF